MIEQRQSWDEFFLGMARYVSTRSKDPSTKVGAVITFGKDIVSVGFNGLPKRMDDNNIKYWQRPLKYDLVIHAEQNAIIQARGQNLEGATLYCTLHPCVDCAKSIIQAGIREVVYHSDSNAHYIESFEKSKSMLEECGVLIRQYVISSD